MPMYKHSDRGPVVHLDRSAKGLMIRAIIEDSLGKTMSGLDVLDVGCGNGGISEVLADDGNQVWGVDVEDKRSDGFPTHFEVVDSERLPFVDNKFDVVVSHHVIEHVEDQLLHLRELRRVLRPNGTAYMATPNRTSPIMSGHVGNEMVLRWPEMAPLFEEAGFAVDDYGWRVLTDPKHFHFSPDFGRFLPGGVARALRRWFPSHMFILSPQKDG